MVLRDLFRRIASDRLTRPERVSSASRRGGVAACLAISAIAAISALGCGSGRPPAAELSMSPSAFVLPYGGFVDLEVQLRPLADRAELGGVPRIFVHLLDEPGSVLRTFDHSPTGEWRQGDELRYTIRVYQSALGEPLEPGVYLLSAGIYLPSGVRLPARTGAPVVSEFEYQVASVQVPASRSGDPAYRFSESWLPVRPGGDRQILARRELGASAGVIEAGPFPRPSTLWMRLVVPKAEGSDARIAYSTGETTPKVRVRSSCDGFAVVVEGSGSHDVDLPVGNAQDPRSCRVDLEPNFRFVPTAGAGESSLVLELLAVRTETRVQ